MSANPTIETTIRLLAERFEQAGLVFGHGTDNALDEAAWLVFHVLALPFDVDNDVYQQRLTAGQQQRINTLARQRIEQRKPLAYLINEAWFCGLKFYVDERVLVPRSPLAELIMDHFQPWLDAGRVGHVLDIGTGSGCIAIACAYAFPAAQVDAVDISPDALAVAQLNIEQHGMAGRVAAIKSDVFANLDGRRYDVIISNPPYVDAEDMATLADEFRHEPELGLASGPLGLDHAERIIRQSGEFLNPGGILIVEVGNSAPALVERFPGLPFTWLEFEHGGHGVFLLTQDELGKYQDTRYLVTDITGDSHGSHQ